MTTRAAHAETVANARAKVFDSFADGELTMAQFNADIDALIAAVRHEAGADRLHPHEDGADTDHSRLAPASAVAPEKPTHAPTTEAGRDDGKMPLDQAKRYINIMMGKYHMESIDDSLGSTLQVQALAYLCALQRALEALNQIGYRGNPPVSEAGRSAQSASAIQHPQIAPPEDEQTDQARSGHHATSKLDRE